MTNEDKLRAVLEEYGASIDYQGWADGDIDHALTQIKQIVVESLGTDEIVKEHDAWSEWGIDIEDDVREIRNELRKELRSKWE